MSGAYGGKVIANTPYHKNGLEAVSTEARSLSNIYDDKRPA
jgi:hypothetical protein